MRERAPHYGFLLVIAPALMALHSFYYLPFFADDGYISLRYAQRLLEGKGLTWNDGLRVEGYSNLLWVLLNAALGWLGFSLEAAARALGLVSALLTLPAFAFLARLLNMPFAACAAATALFLLSPPAAIWAMGGLESDMAMLLFTWAAVLAFAGWRTAKKSDGIQSGLCLGMLCLLRPEGPLYTCAIVLGLLCLPGRKPWRCILFIGLIPALFFAAQLAFRLGYYGQWVPNTVLVKVALTPEHLAYGAVYAAKAAFAFLPVLLYALFNGWPARLRLEDSADRALLRFLTLLLLPLTAAIAFAGGDIFAGFRAFVPLTALICMLAMPAYAIGVRHAGWKKEWVFLGYVLACHAWLQFSIDVNQSPKHSFWDQNAKAIGYALKERYGDAKPVIATHAAGAIPYASRLPTLDVYGLNDPAIAARRHSKKRFGQQLAGHELFDGEYVLSQKPDILVFDIPGLPPLCADDFVKECDVLLPSYRKEILHIPGYDVPIWIRKGSTIDAGQAP